MNGDAIYANSTTRSANHAYSTVMHAKLSIVLRAALIYS